MYVVPNYNFLFTSVHYTLYNVHYTVYPTTAKTSTSFMIR